MTIIDRFAARFDRRCARCRRWIKQGHLVVRLTNGHQVCAHCAQRLHAIGWQRERR